MNKREQDTLADRRETDREELAQSCVNLIFKGGVERGVSGWAAAAAALGACGICKIGEREIVGLLDCWAFGVLQ
jgi:hypothetical protein